MFTGTAIFRAERAQVRRRAIVSTLVVILTATMVTGVWIFGQDAQAQRAWCLTILFAAATFGLGMMLRLRRVPRALALLGRMSYSV